MPHNKKEVRMGDNQYFQGILQLRNPKEEIIEFLLRELEGSKGVFISKEVRLKNGIDLYISSNKFLTKMAKKLEEEFGGEAKISAKLHGRDKQRSKDLYRLSVLYEAPSYSKGDVLLINGMLLKVTASHKILHGIDISSGKKTTVKLKNSRLRGEMEILEKKKTRVAAVHPKISILDPVSYQPAEIMNQHAGKSVQPGEIVTVVEHDGFYIV